MQIQGMSITIYLSTDLKDANIEIKNGTYQTQPLATTLILNEVSIRMYEDSTVKIYKSQYQQSYVEELVDETPDDSQEVRSQNPSEKH